MKNSGINKTDESWYCHCLISYAVLSVIALKELSWHPRNNWVNWRISHMSNSEAMGTTKEIRITKGRQTPRVWDHTQSHPAVWEVVFSFSKKEEEWVFLFEWKRNKEEESKQQVVGDRGMIWCLLQIIQTSVCWIKDKKFGVCDGELRCCRSFFREVTRVRQVKYTRERDGPAGFHSSVSCQPAECCHRGRHTWQITAAHVTTPE